MYTNKEFLDFFDKSKKEALDIVVACVVKTQGSTYSKSGNMLLINSKEEFVGVLGSPYLHKEVLEVSKEVLKTSTTKNLEFTPKDKDSGHGVTTIQIEPFFYKQSYANLDRYLKQPFRVLIFGSGIHVSSFVSMANLMAWEITVMDININKENVKEAHHLVELETLDDIFSKDLQIYQAAVILSHNPKTDDIYLKALTKTNMQYIGMMGNKKNMQRKKQIFNLEDDNRFFAPIGLDIGSYTHQSIALSICSQIEARKNGKI